MDGPDWLLTSMLLGSCTVVKIKKHYSMSSEVVATQFFVDRQVCGGGDKSHDSPSERAGVSDAWRQEILELKTENVALRNTIAVMQGLLQTF